MKKVILITLVFFAILMGGCSKNSKAIEDENMELKKKIAQLEDVVKTKDNKITGEGIEKENFTINYIENASSKRFILNQLELLSFPATDSVHLNSIAPNTVVNIFDTVEVDNVIWLYVSIPVYDSPSNYKGWIKEADTIAYTKDIMSKVQSNITVKSGAKVYETESFEGIKTSTPYKSSGEEQGRIQERKEGYIKLECAGGKTIWVKDTEIIYPEID